MRALWILALALAVASVPDGAARAIGEEEVKASLEAAYPVKVLRIRRGDMDGRAVYLVTMMNEGGDYNAAWQVNTVAVDADTGALVSGFRHRASGTEPNAAPGYGADRQPTDALSSGTVWR